MKPSTKNLITQIRHQHARRRLVELVARYFGASRKTATKLARHIP